MNKNWTLALILSILCLNILAQKKIQPVQKSKTEQEIEAHLQNAEASSEQELYQVTFQSLSKAMDLVKIKEENKQIYQRKVERFLEKRLFNGLSEQRIDSIIDALEGKINSSNFYNLLATEADYTNKDKLALKLAQKALVLSKQEKSKVQESIALYRIGRHYTQSRQHRSKAASFFLKSLALKQSLKDSTGIMKNLINLGNLSYKLYKYDMALEYLMEGLALAKAMNNPKKVLECLDTMCDIYIHIGNYKRALTLIEEIKGQAYSIGDTYHISDAKHSEGKILMQMGNTKKAIPIFKEHLAYLYQEPMPMMGDISRIHSSLGRCYYRQGRYDSTLVHYHKAIQIAPFRKNPYFDMSLFYDKIGDKDKAIKYLNDYLDRMEVVADNEILKWLNNYLNGTDIATDNKKLTIPYDFYDGKSTFYYQTAQLDSAIYYAKKNLAYVKEVGLLYYTASVQMDLGLIYQKKSDWIMAEKYFLESLLEAKKVGRNNTVASNLLHLANVVYEQNKFEEAISYAHQSLSLSKKYYQFNRLSDIYEILSKANEKIGNYEDGLNYQKMSRVLKDSLLGFAQYSRIINYESLFHIEQKEKENFELRLEKGHIEQLANQRRIIVLILIFLILTIILSSNWYAKNARIKAKQKLRQQIAKDIHEEVGIIITNLKITAKEALAEKSSDVLLEKKLNQTIDLGNDAIASLKNLIWKLEKDEDTMLEQMEAEIINFTSKVFSFHQVTYQLNFSGFKSTYPIVAELYSNLMMIYKEILQTIIKQEGTEGVNIAWKFENKKIFLRTKNPIRLGNDVNEKYFNLQRGLKNIRKRSAKINGKVEFKKHKDSFESILILQL